MLQSIQEMMQDLPPLDYEEVVRLNWRFRKILPSHCGRLGLRCPQFLLGAYLYHRDLDNDGDCPACRYQYAGHFATLEIALDVWGWTLPMALHRLDLFWEGHPAWAEAASTRFGDRLHPQHPQQAA